MWFKIFRRGKGNGNGVKKAEQGVQKAEEERQKSEGRLRESTELRNSLARMHRENHIAPMIRDIIDRRAQGQP